ncbi:MAG: MAPEG family protein [Gammaproteobacteria bacterium]|nr:MAPEG family protein [Gammaproteobacteria bacterium]
MLAIAALFLVQLLVLDLTGIRAKHVPGTPIPADHNSFLFRATRAHANTNESIAAFILLTVIAVFASASSAWTNVSAWVYVAGRLGHMLCYYADLRAARSVAFAVSLLALLSLLLAALTALL